MAHTANNTIAHYRTERGANQALVLLGGSINEDGGASLIPEASVLLGDRAAAAVLTAELRSRPLLMSGDLIYIQGYADQLYQAHKQVRNPDWWDLVPVGGVQWGRRFYYDFEGFGSYKIRDAMSAGAIISWETAKRAIEQARAVNPGASAKAIHAAACALLNVEWKTAGSPGLSAHLEAMTAQQELQNERETTVA